MRKRGKKTKGRSVKEERTCPKCRRTFEVEVTAKSMEEEKDIVCPNPRCGHKFESWF